LGHGLSHVLSLMHPHTCHQALLDTVTACVSHTENTTKFCGCGKSRVHYLAHCCQPTILHCTACCTVLSKLILIPRCVLSGCTVTSWPPCIGEFSVEEPLNCLSTGCRVWVNMMLLFLLKFLGCNCTSVASLYV